MGFQATSERVLVTETEIVKRTKADKKAVRTKMSGEKASWKGLANRIT